MGSIIGSGKIKMASAYNLMSQQEHLTIVHTEKLIKGTITGRMLSSDISHVAFASVYLEKSLLKKCWIMIIIIAIIMIARIEGFSWAPEIDFR